MAPGADLARQLTGNLPCVSCRYNLRGLSVKGVCPECGTPVRAAILAAVDPYAPILQPVTRARAVALGLLVWSGGALAAALLTWGLRAADLVATLSERPLPTRTMALAGCACIVLSGLGALALLRPHARIPLWATIGAAAGVLATLLLAPVYWRIHAVFDPSHVRPYLQMAVSLPERSYLRLAKAALLLVVIFGLRPNARLLAARSLLLRMGRVDRQAMLAMGVAVGLWIAGDLLTLLAPRAAGGAEWASTFGLFLIALGSMLFTVGLFGVFTDVLRIAAVLLNPPAAPAEVVGPDGPAVGPPRGLTAQGPGGAGGRA
ncbi:MAG: hypothetical protein WD749_10040 [Phycisphaerales bacterium]